MSEFYEKILSYQKEGKVYVMADLGSNYKSEDDLMNAIWLAKAMKIDAIKYQWFTVDELYGPSPRLNHKFPLKKIADEAKLKGIDFLCTARVHCALFFLIFGHWKKRIITTFCLNN